MNLKRLREILTTLTKHGFAHVVVHAGLDSFLPSSMRIKVASIPEELHGNRLNNAIRLTRVIEELGATFIKFGQVLATRPDIMPPEYIEAFSKLQENVAPLAFSEIKKVIESSLKNSCDTIFASIDEEALASGSIGQVHRAVLLSGDRVVIKVKKPGTDQVVKDDLALLKYLAGVLAKHFPETSSMRPEMVVDEFAQCMERELDFITEGAFTEKFTKQFAIEKNILAPKVFWDYVTHSTLVLEELEGHSLSIYKPESHVEAEEIANKLTRCFMQQYFKEGFFHSDPHPGNIFVLNDKRIALIDYGQVGQIPSDMKKQFVIMLIALSRGDIDVVTDFFSTVGVVSEHTNLRDFRNEFGTFITRYYGLPMDKMDIGVAINESISIARRNGLILPRDFVLLAKSFITIQGVIRKTCPDYDVTKEIKPFLKKTLPEFFNPKEISWSFGFYIYRLFNLLKRTPEDLQDLMSKARAGKTRIIFHHEGLEEVSTQVERASNRITLGLLISAILLGSSIILASGSELVNKVEVPFLTGVPVSAIIASAGYLAAMCLGFWLAWAILKGKRL